MCAGEDNTRIQEGTGTLTGPADNPLNTIIHARAILAPMSGITDFPFRMIARKFGCKFAFTEMIDVNGIVYNNRKSFRLMEKMPGDSPLGVQIVGQEASRMLYAAHICEERGFDLLDINAGCPARKVIKGGKGAALLKDPRKLAEIVRAVVKGIGIPVTVKIRSGWDEDNLNYMEVAKAAAGEGAAAICIHARTKEQMYKGKANLEIVRDMKDKLKIPIFASGSIFSAQDVLDTLNLTGCDAVFVARGAFGKPWIFRDVENFLAGNCSAIKPAFDEIKDVISEHFKLSLEYHGEITAFKRMYKHLAWYLRGFKDLDKIMKEYSGLKEGASFYAFLDRIQLKDDKFLKLKGD